MENYYFKGQSTDLIKDHFLYFIGNAKHIFIMQFDNLREIVR